MFFSLKTPFNFFRKSHSPITVTALVAIGSDWQSFVDKHNTWLEKITAAGMGMNADTPILEKVERLNYMDLHIPQLTKPSDRVKVAGRILDATAILMKDPESSPQNALHYLCDACEIIFNDVPKIQSTEPALAISVVENAFSVAAFVASQDETTFFQPLIEALEETKAGLARDVQPSQNSDCKVVVAVPTAP